MVLIPFSKYLVCEFDSSDYSFYRNVQEQKQNDGVRDPSPIKKSTSASPITTQASTAAASISASTPSQSSTVVVAKGTRALVLRLVHELCQRAPVVSEQTKYIYMLVTRREECLRTSLI